MIKLAHPLIEQDEQQAVLDALSSGQLAQGPRVAAFERAFAEYVGVRHAVAVNSGTAALHVALLANDVGAAGEVIVPSFSFAASANTVLHTGARLVFVDVRNDDFGIEAAEVEAAITPRTRAVVAVHLYGQPCDVDALTAICRRRNVALIEDAAQAVGASIGGRRAGSFGTGTFSFYATKNLTTGEGGMITTNDNAIAEKARLWRGQGERERYVTDEPGYNYRMTEVAAALGLAQLPKLDGRNEQRRANAMRLNELLSDASDVIRPIEVPGRHHVWHQYTIRVASGRDARDGLQARLRERGIESAAFYPIPIHQQPLYERLGYAVQSHPVAEQLADEVLSLPVHPWLSEQDLTTIASATSESLRELVG